MHQRRAAPARGHRAGAREERGLTRAAFVGSFPAAAIRLSPRRPEVALLGRSNVGKSSLVNALLGRRRLARIGRTPGTTRMCNVYDVGRRFYLVDLPGYGYARASHETRRAVARLLEAYLREREPLAGVVWLLDARRDPSADDVRMGRIVGARGVPVLAAVTKADKVSRGRRRERLHAIRAALGMTEDQTVVTSARTKEGIGELWQAIEGLV